MFGFVGVWIVYLWLNADWLRLMFVVVVFDSLFGLVINYFVVVIVDFLVGVRTCEIMVIRRLEFGFVMV